MPIVINGASRKMGGWFAMHLQRTDHNDRVKLVEIRGLMAETINEAFREMELVASGTQVRNYFYHANINPRDDELLTPEQWARAVDVLERELGLTDQPRFVVEHEKNGRTHQHVIWSRINSDSMSAISDSLTYRKHERAARALEQEFELEPLESVLVKGREKERPQRDPQNAEPYRGRDGKRDGKGVAAEVTALWHAADSAPAFAAALADHGYILARGDRRDFCIVDASGNEHSLGRRVNGVKAAGISARMAEIDREALPSVAEARALARQRGDEGCDPESMPEAPKEAGPGRPRDAEAARARVRAAAGAFATQELQSDASTPATAVGGAPPRRFASPRDAAIAAEEVRALAGLFADAIMELGAVPELVAEIVSDGFAWWQRAADRLVGLVDEARETVRSWREYVLAERDVENRDDGLDID
jgi:hypothetical protein